MALVVEEIMDRDPFTLRPTDDIETASEQLVSRGISGAPVIDVAARLLGMISWRDLIAPRAGRTVAERMSSPAITVSATARVTEAARCLAEQDLHRVAVVDAEGRVVGMLSTLDVLEALWGAPVGRRRSTPPPPPSSFRNRLR